MKARRRQQRPSGRRLLLLVALLCVPVLAYLGWSPGRTIRDGRHDLRSNGIWLQHGWLGDDAWFERNQKTAAAFRDDRKLCELAAHFARHGMKYVFPHAAPCDRSGRMAPVDPEQAERFLVRFRDFQVIPWVGGVLQVHCFPESPAWRNRFVASVRDLFHAHPGFAGVQVNIEPMPSGNPDFLVLLDELREALPAGKLLAVAAYPPPTRWHPHPEVHWDEAYYRQVSRRADLLAVMMYDTALTRQKIYRHLMAAWTAKALDWTGDTRVLLGIPAYDDVGVGYHDPRVENLRNALAGVHAELSRRRPLPANYTGVAIYSEWEMDPREWDCFEREFEKVPKRAGERE